MTSLLQKHPFLTEVTDHGRPFLIAAAEHVRRNSHRELEAQAENRRRMTPVERYTTSVTRRTLGLYGTLQALEDARRLIGVFPTQLGKGKAAMSRDRWVDYHYGYFTVSLASIPDVTLVLASTVYQLGLGFKHCTLDVVTSHGRIKGTQMVKLLRELSNSVQSVKERRNRHVHRGEQANVESLSPDSFLRDLKAITLLRSVEPSLADRKLVTEAWREAGRQILPILNDEANQVEKAISAVLDVLLLEYRRIYRAFERVSAPRQPTI